MDIPCVPYILERPFQLGEQDSWRVSPERVVATKTLKAPCSVLVSSAGIRTGQRRCGLPLKPLMDYTKDDVRKWPAKKRMQTLANAVSQLKFRIETEEYIYEEYFEA